MKARSSSNTTPTNLGAIFLYWRDNVFTGKGPSALTPTEQVDVFLRCLFQPGDVYLHPTKRGVLVVPGYPDGVTVSADSYRSFFDHFAQTHGHHHVFVVDMPVGSDDSAASIILQVELDFLAIEHAQSVHHVFPVESDLERITLVNDSHFFLRHAHVRGVG